MTGPAVANQQFRVLQRVVLPGDDLDVVAGQPRYGEYKYAINNSFGFGGHNVALAFGKY